ncbi:hypothetical protein SapgrDRAFT_1712 [Saprospira grandis DSM 2844]|uniref:Uncharacterized protein n=1 Tax=Saprospira grandis DSM 2844 TaxID=694433 RepID=J0XWJ7_9BACT|nr:hypothetical protein SapgrDRAFT_1712 [Saprospira grandis DSM 2844]
MEKGFYFFWGCPALRAGRAVRGLAARSAHRGLRPLGLAFGPPLPSLSLRRLCRLLEAEHQMAEAIGQKLAPKEERPSDV